MLTRIWTTFKQQCAILRPFLAELTELMQIGLFIRRCFWALLSLSITTLLTLAFIILYLEAHLPSTESLKNVQMQIPLRVYTKDNQLIGVFGEKRRIPVTLDQIPKPLIQAVLATEDQRFFDHSGVDLIGLSRAAYELVRTGTKSQGGSTITMQVARNFFLSPKKSFIRKINEVLLAIKIDQTLTKEKILELYLNKIYFGNRAYGVEAAADVYYGKPVAQLSLPELALLAGLPKAPSSLNPLVNPIAAKERRNHVLSRMLVQNYIDTPTYEKAIQAPLTASYHEPKTTLRAPYAAEMVRQAMVERFGEEAYTKGYQVYTTIDSKLQLTANQSLRNALINYDRRHGFRPIKVNLSRLLNTHDTIRWVDYLKTLRTVNSLRPAVVSETTTDQIKALLSSGETITIPWTGLQWTGRSNARQLAKTGDLIRVALQTDGSWRLAQIPQIEGALIAISPQDGSIQAVTGGFDFATSNFNRATQADRQAGSSFKPFIYSAAFEKGYTLASIINDAPIIINDPSLPDMVWRPQNDTHKFYGPTRLRVALAHSRNLVTIRLLRAIGISDTTTYLNRFGFDPKKIPKTLSLALGTASLTPLEMTAAYTVFANGGHKISPFIIERIADAQGKTQLTANPKIACDACENEAPTTITPQNAFLMTSVLQEVIRTGTGHAAMELGRQDLAGKTGTSDDMKDGWFIGFNSDLVVGAWVGFDQPRSTYEHGSQTALPMWIEFMRAALKDKPEHTMEKPDGIVSAKIDPETGTAVSDSASEGITEYFKEEDLSSLSTPHQEAEESDGGEGTMEIHEVPDDGHLF